MVCDSTLDAVHNSQRSDCNLSGLSGNQNLNAPILTWKSQRYHNLPKAYETMVSYTEENKQFCFCHLWKRISYLWCVPSNAAGKYINLSGILIVIRVSDTRAVSPKVKRLIWGSRVTYHFPSLFPRHWLLPFDNFSILYDSKNWWPMSTDVLDFGAFYY